MKSRSRLLLTMVSLTTASFYFAQSKTDSLDKSNEIEQVIITGVADIAKDRKTPVAVSNIKAAQIIEKLGNQELPEILSTTPSVYATKSGGGFGDGSMTIRGFESRNIAVMINGMPVNDMETGQVFFSNWTGLSDVTSTIQVQRGLGSSKLAIASVGGTVNFLTRSADMKKGGVVRLGVGNNNYLKTAFSYNTGKSQSGWSSSFLMSRTAGATYVENTNFEAYTYFFALGFEPNKKHSFQFSITAAPQWHDQRSSAPTIADYIQYNPKKDGNPYRAYNSDFGYFANAFGRREALSNRSNYFSKPVMMFNWDYNMSKKAKLSTVLYTSNGRGGGMGDIGSLPHPTPSRPGETASISFFKDNEGHIDFDRVFGINAGIDANTAGRGGTIIRRSSINSHDWYGILANFQYKVNDHWNFSVGTDDRYYYGYHYQVPTHFYGANGYKDGANRNTGNRVFTTPLLDYKKLNWNPLGGKIHPLEQHIGYSNDGEVLWYSGFGQVEYSKNDFSAFVQGSVSNQSYQRVDHFIQDGVTTQQGQVVNKKTGFKDILGYNIKGGANYNINQNHNAFVNVGYYSKQPFFNAVYPSFQQVVNPNLTNEKIFSTEVGYGFRGTRLNVNVNLYRTEWRDRFMRVTLRNLVIPGMAGVHRGYSEINGITQIHRGVEIDAQYKALRWLELNGMFSYGDYRYKGNAVGANFDESNNMVSGGQTTLYLNNVKVGGSGNNSIPQMTASLGLTLRPIRGLNIFGNWRYTGKLYSSINVNDFQNIQNQERGVLQLPDFNLFDAGFSYKLSINKEQAFSVGLNVYNLLDTTYIADSSTNIFKGDSGATGVEYKGIDTANRVFFGFGRTWSANIAFHF